MKRKRWQRRLCRVRGVFINMNPEKKITLLSGCFLGFYWRIRLSVRQNGSFHAKGNISVMGKRYDKFERVRRSDRTFFNRHIGAKYMKGKQIHHDWRNGATCYLLEAKNHILIHRRGLI